ncbi:hypothetical protein NQ314_015451 [Rhamnusium bicolor]|uniref:Uncharacterized protein n=1 Tax=Rhamnusium bicolor TaxID=1586634 RepID=A0AAV8WYF2_9CUCU|nr:hypothetical protein NQ314_015451 [Rhamnusium bicolor]
MNARPPRRGYARNSYGPHRLSCLPSERRQNITFTFQNTTGCKRNHNDRSVTHVDRRSLNSVFQVDYNRRNIDGEQDDIQSGGERSS